MKILSLEFSSSRRSVAVLDGNTVLAEQAEAVGQTAPPLQLIEQALAAAKLSRKAVECIALGLGPGSYTGIRGTIALAQGWQLAGSVKLLGVSSVLCIAAQAQADGIFGRVNVVVDAQRGELYLAGYEITVAKVAEVAPLRLVTLAEAQRELGFFVGPEVKRWFAGGLEISPSAAFLGRLAAGRQDFVPGDQLEPLYLRATSFVKAPPVKVLES
jgi:tRNA threonylcarbamoyl adenosine modification protein YeaZ